MIFTRIKDIVIIPVENTMAAERVKNKRQLRCIVNSKL